MTVVNCTLRQLLPSHLKQNPVTLSILQIVMWWCVCDGDPFDMTRMANLSKNKIFHACSCRDSRTCYFCKTYTRHGIALSPTHNEALHHKERLLVLLHLRLYGSWHPSSLRSPVCLGMLPLSFCSDSPLELWRIVSFFQVWCDSTVVEYIAEVSLLLWR